jgi:hypothetical protein
MGVEAFQNILYYALTQLTGPADVFSDFRQDMIDAATLLYPSTCEPSIVRKAFDAVGIYASGTTPPARPPGPDPMITPWGARSDNPPYWQTPDIYVKDAAGNPAAPLKNQVNRLFARITNIGDAAANGTSVAFSFVPYGAGTGTNAAETIGTVSVDVPPGMSREAEIAWDLTDLTDTNGGLWPLPLSAFEHFCVKVSISHPSDVDSCNNDAQNNFGDVGTADGLGDGRLTFLVGNRFDDARWVAVFPDPRVPRTWKLRLDLTDAVRDSFDALRSLTVSKRPELPWAGFTRDAVLLPLRARELRAATLAWTVDRTDHYDGPVHGLAIGVASGRAQDAGRFEGALTHMRLVGDTFEAGVEGTIRQKRHALAVRGVLSGRVDRKTGDFTAALTGRSRYRGKQGALKLMVEGRLGASATFSVVVVNGDDVQGLDLAATVVGHPTTLRRDQLFAAYPLAKPGRAKRRAKTRRKGR